MHDNESKREKAQVCLVKNKLAGLSRDTCSPTDLLQKLTLFFKPSDYTDVSSPEALRQLQDLEIILRFLRNE